MSKKIKVGYIVDSSIGLYGEEIVSEDTRQVFFNITDKNDVEYNDDNKVLTSKKILEEFDSGNFFKTSAVSPGKVILEIEDLLEKYEKIIIFTVSSGLSSYYDNIKYLEEEYKNQVYVVDTKEIGFAIKKMVESAKEKINNGEDFFEVLSYCKDYYKYNFTSFTCQNWSPLVNSGRVPKSLSKILNALKTRPVINFDIKNKLGGIVKSFESSVEKIISQFKKVFGSEIFSDPDYVVFYNNRIDQKKAEYIREKILKTFKISKDKLIEMFVPNLVLVYTANGSFGLHIKSKIKSKNRD
ncbi:MAG: DegV family protein [Malacoplasma sp.]|nr:DegV family protein [Malacoplasma sp.]MDE5841651.1 DegV family protein [Malacoplasma sp.]MDE6082723.1 DegV family protein [Malacoplasma sp.]